MKILFVLDSPNWTSQKLANLVEKKFKKYEFSYLYYKDKTMPYPPNIEHIDVVYFSPWWTFFPTSKISIAWFTHIYEFKNQSLEEMKKVAKQINFGLATRQDLFENLPCKSFLIANPASFLTQYSKRLRLFFPGMLKTRKGREVIKVIKKDPRFSIVISNAQMSNEEILEQYRLCDLVIMPSLSEGGPFCLPESILYNRPILMTKTGEWDKYRDIQGTEFVEYKDFYERLIQYWQEFRKKQKIVEKWSKHFLTTHKKIFNECNRLFS